MKSSTPLPGPQAFCNDIAVDANGAVYVTDSAAPNVLRLPAGGATFEFFASSPQFLPPKAGSAGLDGIAFGGDGNLYVTTYAAGGFFRIVVEPTKTATHAGRNGYLWILDRDRLRFLYAFPFSNNNVFTSIDPATGRPTVDESKRPGAQRGAEFCPSIGGGKDWPPEAWSPQTKLLYIPANNNICAYLPKGQVPDEDSKGLYVRYDADSIFGSVRAGPGPADHVGELQAWDLNTGKRVWQHNFKTVLWAPLLVTGGGILFAGGTPDREFRAFDAHTGDQLWSFPLPSAAEGVRHLRSTANSMSPSRRAGILTHEAFRPASRRSVRQRPRWLRAAPSWSSSSSDQASG